MGDRIPSLFENLGLRYWYKYLLYVAGILLILVAELGSKIPQDKVISFSLWTMGLMIFLWILDDIIWAAHTMKTQKAWRLLSGLYRLLFSFFG